MFLVPTYQLKPNNNHWPLNSTIWHQTNRKKQHDFIRMVAAPHGQELIEIWWKTFLYTYFIVNLPDLFLFYVQLYDIIKITTTHLIICTMWFYLFNMPNELQLQTANYKLKTAIQMCLSFLFSPYLSQILMELLTFFISLWCWPPICCYFGTVAVQQPNWQ